MPRPEGFPKVPFVPTPLDITKQILRVADQESDDVIIDVGSGDGRIARLAAIDYGCTSIGIEKNPLLAKYSFTRIGEAKVKNAHIVFDDFFHFDYGKADIVTMYLTSAAVRQLAPLLQKKLPADAKIVSHNYLVPGFKLETYEGIQSQEDRKPHYVALYRNSLNTRPHMLVIGR